MLINLVILIAIVTVLVLTLTATGIGLSKRHSGDSPLGYEAECYKRLACYLAMFDLVLVVFACGLWLLNQW